VCLPFLLSPSHFPHLPITLLILRSNDPFYDRGLACTERPRDIPGNDASCVLCYPTTLFPTQAAEASLQGEVRALQDALETSRAAMVAQATPSLPRRRTARLSSAAAAAALACGPDAAVQVG